MYILASALRELPIISLQTGETVALAKEPILDAGELGVLALRCLGSHGKIERVLMMRDVRQFATDCLIVDTEDELADPADVVRLQSLLAQQLHLEGTAVVTQMGQRLGNVEDFTINLETARLQKLYIRQSLLRSWLGSSLIIDRAQIVDVTQQQIVVRDATVQAPTVTNETIPESQPNA